MLGVISSSTVRMNRSVSRQIFKRWQHTQKRESFPWVWSLAAAYAGSSFGLSVYYLFSMDEVEAASYRSRTTAWGEERQLEGLDEVATWIDWSASSAGVDLIPKLVGVHRVEECIALGASSNRAEVRAVALEAAADLTTNDELARRICARTNLREAIVLELERVAAAPRPRTAVEWGELYANRLAVLNALANVTASEKIWTEVDVNSTVSGSETADPKELLDRLVPALLSLLSELRAAYIALRLISAHSTSVQDENTETQDENTTTTVNENLPPAGALTSRKSAYLSEAAGAASAATKSNRLASWMTELQESAIRDVIAELILVATRVVHHVAMLDGGAERLSTDQANLDLLAEFTWNEEIDAAVHAIMALRHTLHFDETKISSLNIPDDAVYLSCFDTWSPRSTLAVFRSTEVLNFLPISIAAGWGAMRRLYQWHASSDVFMARATSPSSSAYYRSLGRALLHSSASTVAVVTLLSTLYGPRGIRYELRRSFYGGDSDFSQIGFAAAFISADLALLFSALRAAPFFVTPFFVLNTLVLG